MRNFSINSDIALDYIKQENIGVYVDLLIGTSASLWHYTRPRARRYLYVLTSTNVSTCGSAMTLAPFVIHHLSTIRPAAQRRPAPGSARSQSIQTSVNDAVHWMLTTIPCHPRPHTSHQLRINVWPNWLTRYAAFLRRQDYA